MNQIPEEIFKTLTEVQADIERYVKLRDQAELSEAEFYQLIEATDSIVAFTHTAVNTVLSSRAGVMEA